MAKISMGLPRTIDFVAALKKRDAARAPERLALKYKAMRESAFAFFRGTTRGFYEHLAEHESLPAAPAVWACGDLHLQNFARLDGADSGSVFAVNDFDECLLAPAWWDVLRGASSLWLARKQLNLDKVQAKAEVAAFVAGFARHLAAGAAGPVPTATQQVSDRAAMVKAVAARAFKQGGKLYLRTDGRYALPATAAQHRAVQRLLAMPQARAAGITHKNLLDVARRVAGLASLGTKRFVILAGGTGKLRGPRLLDLKQAHAPGGARLTGLAQPTWASPAARVAEIEKRAQPGAPGVLLALGTARNAMVLRDLRPREARLAMADLGTGKALHTALQGLACASADVHLNTAGFGGAADLVALAAFGAGAGWRLQVTMLAIAMARQSRQDWLSFAKAYDAGVFG